MGQTDRQTDMAFFVKYRAQKIKKKYAICVLKLFTFLAII